MNRKQKIVPTLWAWEPMTFRPLPLDNATKPSAKYFLNNFFCLCCYFAHFEKCLQSHEIKCLFILYCKYSSFLIISIFVVSAFMNWICDKDKFNLSFQRDKFISYWHLRKMEKTLSAEITLFSLGSRLAGVQTNWDNTWQKYVRIRLLIIAFPRKDVHYSFHVQLQINMNL
jgi:hypothetical protein